MSELIKKKVRAAIVQDPVISQAISGTGKNLVLNIMINGNDAIDRACADDGDILAAMKHIISVLPDPKIVWLTSLAMTAAIELTGSRKNAGELLGLHRCTISRKDAPYKKNIKAIQDGEIFGDTEELPGGAERGG